MSSSTAAPGSPAGRKMTNTTKSRGAPKRKKKGLRQSQMPGARNLFRDGAFGVAKPGEHVSSQAHAGGRRRRRKSKRKSRKKSHKKKRKTKRRRKSRKKKTKRRRRR
jgi:hypothetical protein